MDPKLVHTKENPKENANLVNKLFFWWTKELFWKGFHKQLTLSDLYRPLRVDESERLGNRLEGYWKEELKKLNKQNNNNNNKKKKNEPRLEKALFRAFWSEHLYMGLLMFFQYGVLTILHPLLQSLIISYFKVENEIKETTESDALIYAGCLIICITVIVFVQHHSDMMALQIGMKLRVACSSLIYRKVLRLSKGALIQTTPGQIVNFLSNDVSRFDELSFYLNFIWITPLQIIIIAAIIWQKIGILTIVTIGSLMLIILPIHSIFIKLSGKMRRMIAVLTDKRIQLMNELITGIQVVKMYAWEEPFAKIVADIRAAEMKKIKFTSYVRAMYYGFSLFTTRTVLFFTLLSFILTGNDLSAEITYMLSTYFEIFQLSAAHFFPNALILTTETMISIKRLEKFLLLEEQSKEESSSLLDTEQNSFLKFKEVKEKVEFIRMIDANRKKVASSNESKERGSVSIVLERVSANWIAKQLPPSICNVSIKIQSGQLCALIGPVGSGKSSLLYLLLNELPVGAGSLKMHCKPLEQNIGQNNQGQIVETSNLRISYASQEPWLFSGTIRENILFGQPYDKARYIAVTKACALTRDFKQFPQGDTSNVGEGGSSLSGGQRARVNLARAVYKRADLYLFDDPLSAVDARVAKHLFHKCIEKYLYGKTRILVTHQLQFVKQADIIVVLDKGSVKMQGSYEELSKSNQDFNEMMNRIKFEAKKQEIENSDAAVKNGPSNKISCRVSVTSNASSVVSYDYEDERFEEKGESEAIASGYVANKVYKEYFHHGGSYYMLFALLFIIIVSETATCGNDYWVSYWTNLETVRRLVTNKTDSVNNTGYNYMFNNKFLSSMFTLDDNGLLPTDGAIYLYTFCIISCIVTVLVRNLFFMKICTDAGKNLHNSMFSNVLRAMMSFFHNNTSGRILNRFSKDVGAMDELLPKTMLETLQILIVIFGVLLMILVVNYWMIIPLVILFLLFYHLRLLYLKTAQNVKRLEAVAKSPMFSHVNATLTGLTTIRTSGSDIVDLLRKQFDDLQDVHTGVWYMTLAVSAVFGLLLDLAACFFIGCVCFSFILFNTGDTLGGDVGLAISQSMILIGLLQYGVKQSSNMVLQITAVERILQYTDLPKEPPWKSDDPPPADWPNHGKVVLRNITLKYNPKNSTPVLKNLNVTIEAGWKVGVVGRTGAGKSSLISALFRLFDEGLEGEIMIDGRDTKTLGLHELRSRLSIIPQQPFLFSDSLRYNLDPFHSYDDTLLWESLRQVELNDHLLDQKVTQSGSNLSIGQRQLICLARAILRNNRILVLDEATANIDSRTDALIQNTIRTRFANCTVITVAHRLLTIIDSDKIIVMDDGRIAEFGCAHELLRDKPTGIFSQMVNNTNATMAQTLRSEAEKVYLKITGQSSRRTSGETDASDTIMQSEL
ncbi:ATP-binding cassette subfamily C member 4 [Osmia lignaria lignaria]|uniref:ATP-binding cassette subfamily C member 4 n=1 Tax=Osmia lignaria lignaria TaxID=1437193 RepID=UPI00402B4A11